MWKLRRHCMQMPNILPRLLDAVNWNSRDDMTHLYLLLQEWPQVNNKEDFFPKRHLFGFGLTTIIFTISLLYFKNSIQTTLTKLGFR